MKARATDWWTASLDAQRRVLDAQRAALAAGTHAVAVGDTAVTMQRAARHAAEANMAAWTAWARLWGVR